MAGQGTFRKQCLWDSGKVPLGLRATARDEKKMMQLASLRQASSFFPTHSPASQEEPDPCIQALLSESSLLLCSWHAKEKGHYWEQDFAQERTLVSCRVNKKSLSFPSFRQQEAFHYLIFTGPSIKIPSFSHSSDARRILPVELLREFFPDP